MAKLELTPKREAIIKEAHAEFLALGLCCDRADKARAEAAFARAYRTIGREPVPVIWVASPMTASLAIHVLGLRDSLGASLGGSQIQPHYSYWWGQQDLYWVAYYRVAARMGVQFETSAADRLDIMEEIGRSCMWWYPRDGIIIACDRPAAVHMDDQHRLHCEDGPAVLFRDGWSVHAVHGVRVPAWIVEKPDEITPAKIDAEDNAEIRRVMMDRYGIGRYVAESGAKVVDQCGADHALVGLRGARLLSRELPDHDRPAVVVECVNSTAEPDGSFKTYHLSVNPDHYGGRAGREVLAAMASTWRAPDGSLLFARPEDYAPEVET